MFTDLEKNPDYPAMEARILRFWSDNRIFDKLRAKNQGKPRFSFIDGPITANNPMGIHHAWGRTYKDVFQRFQAMTGHELRYQNGFDCQGLWVEVEVEKELGFKSKHDIEKYGIGAFVDKCKERVQKYAAVQAEQSKRLGYWMDWENSYYTLSDENNYTIWHFLRRCHEKGWIYKGHDVMPWCPRCGTALSDMEIATEGYREITHTSLMVRFPLIDHQTKALLVWTTTPWTLAANVAAAVHPEMSYVEVEQDGWSFILAKAALSRCLKEPYRVLREMPGSELVGLRYRCPFDELPAQEGIEHRVIPWTEVSQEEGTGVVHIAPGCGKEDFALGKEFGLPAISPLDEAGIYLEGFGPFSGQQAGAVPRAIRESLAAKNLLQRAEPYTHRYPVCWRCGSELLFRRVDEWFISMRELRHQIMANVPTATWIPSFCQEREMDWLRNMGDWCISKKRYWGLALPIYQCSCGWFDVVGGEDELESRAAEGWDQFAGHSPHRPWVDAVEIRCGACGKLVSRVPDVGNPWLDAGIVPFSTLRYRHDREHWAKWFPADLVTECFPGQFRNWFYALLTMSTVLEDCAPFRTLLGHASVRDEKGNEMHKSAGNAIWFEEAADKVGADILRWIFVRQNVAVNLQFGWSAAREAHRELLTLWNTAGFFVTYANLDQPDLRVLTYEHRTDMDRWMLSLTQSLIEKVTAAMSRHDCATAARDIRDYIGDVSNWYVRRCRRRFWKGTNDDDKTAAYQTLYEVLSAVTGLLAPLLPFTAEEIYQAAVRPAKETSPESVHLCDWPVANRGLLDPQLEADMRAAMIVTRLGLSARNAAGIKVRQPLPRLLVYVGDASARSSLERFRETVLEELNVKAMGFAEQLSDLVETRLKPNLPVLGPKWGARLGEVVKALACCDPDAVARLVGEGLDVEVELHGEKHLLAPGEILVERVGKSGAPVAEEGGMVVTLDTTITEELRLEGLARDFVRHVQDLRKDSGLDVADRIVLQVCASGEIARALDCFRDYVQGETLAVEMRVTDTVLAEGQTLKVGGEAVAARIRKR